jgi:hypothetical protein
VAIPGPLAGLNSGVAALFQPHQLPYLPGAVATDLYTGEEVWLR